MRDYIRHYARKVAEERATAQSALAEIEAMHTAFGRLLAFEVYEAPVTKTSDGIGKARMTAWKGIGIPHDGNLPCIATNQVAG